MMAFRACKRGDACRKAGSFSDATPWDPVGGRKYGFRYHGIDIYPTILLGAISYNQEILYTFEM